LLFAIRLLANSLAQAEMSSVFAAAGTSISAAL
jgi:hypothetical protein